ncbi:MAG: RHS repeat-associated core domain-containing protein [bacterium]|nr:RHS repeat-associated core domain-containing protein [bacterium]
MSSLTTEADTNSAPPITLFGDDPPVALNGEPTLVVSKYYYLNSLRVAKSVDGELNWIHSDHLHSATILTDAAGAEFRRLAYRAFGEEAENVGSGSAPKYSYTGKELDSSGLMYYGARYYDPALSRFITPDTMYDGASPQGLNRYSYVLNNPIIYRDPTGHEHWYEPYTRGVANAHERVNAQLDQLDAASGYHPVMMAINDGVVKTVYDVGFGIAESGAGLIPVGEQIGEWLADPTDPNKVPIVGPAGKEFGESVGEAIVDPSVETVSRAVAATANTVGIAVGGVQTARMTGISGTKGNTKISTETPSNPVHNQANAQRLQQQLASEEQMSELLTGQGEPIIGSGTNNNLRAAQRLAEEYGGNPGDWAKVRSSNKAHVTGYNQETHAYQNMKTGEIVEMKTKIQGH